MLIWTNEGVAGRRSDGKEKMTGEELRQQESTSMSTMIGDRHYKLPLNDSNEFEKRGPARMTGE